MINLFEQPQIPSQQVSAKLGWPFGEATASLRQLSLIGLALELIHKTWEAW